jgi:hypothetical protein
MAGVIISNAQLNTLASNGPECSIVELPASFGV